DLHALAGMNVGDEQHVWTVLVPPRLEPLVSIFSQHARREGPERFAELRLEVHQRLHLGRARVSDDRARSQRTRPELHAPREVSHHLLGGDLIRNDVEQRRLVGLMVVARTNAVESLPDLFGSKARAQERAALEIAHTVDLPRPFEQLMPHEKSGSHGAARVARPRLNEDSLEPPVAS